MSLFYADTVAVEFFFEYVELAPPVGLPPTFNRPTTTGQPQELLDHQLRAIHSMGKG
jgi:hypothetical protein